MIGLLFTNIAYSQQQTNTTNQNKALGFDGVGDVIVVESNESLELESFTIEDWIFPEGESKKDQGIITKSRSYMTTVNYYIAILWNSMKLNGLFKHNALNGSNSNTFGFYAGRVRENRWNHICMTYSGPKNGELSIYVNGKLSRSDKNINAVPMMEDYPVLIGSTSERFGFYKGGMDEVRIWNRALSKNEINQNIKIELTGNENGLVLYYDFFEISEDRIIKDLSPEGNDGIFRGNPSFFESTPKIKMNLKNQAKLQARIDTMDQDEKTRVKPKYPASLSATIEFREPSGNNLLDADERGALVVTLTNTGQGSANGLEIVATPDSFYNSLSVAKPKRVERLASSQSRTIEIPISAGLRVDTRQNTFTVSVRESNGFDLYPSLKISFGTQELIPPVLAVVDYAVEDFNNNRKIERSEMVKITARVQNSGNGKARKAQATVSVGANVFISPDSRTTFDLSELAPGEYKDIEFSLFANNKATSVPVTITLTEHYGKYGAEKKLDLPFEVIQKAPTEMIVEGTFAEVRSFEDAPELLADVDRNIPQAVSRNRDAVAVIIGNRNYTCGDIPTVDYAVNDASVMRSYLTDLLGYEEGNIIYLENASQSDLRSVFGTEQFGGRLANMVKDNISDVFIYYSGHGAPDPNSKRGYFLPVDCCPNDVRLNGYPLDLFYKNMGKLQPKSLTIAIDACFSGGSNKGMLTKNASPVSIEVENQATVGDSSTVFTSSASNEISSWYPEKKHGLFTYFFLKGLRGDADSNKDKKLTSQELHNYISDKTQGVPYYARSIYNGRVQTPSISGDGKMVIVEYK